MSVLIVGARTSVRVSPRLYNPTLKAATYFDVSLATLKKKVGTGGDGTSTNSPLKLVLLLT
ncbi:hypothetical protein ACC738_38790, partial [Rhizobium ruizarguesonis]